MEFFQSFEEGMDARLADYVSRAVANLCAVIAPAVTAGIVIYIILIGFAIIRGEQSDTLGATVWRVVKWSLVSAVALSAGGFNTYVLGGLNGIESALLQATTGLVSGGQLLDQCLDAYISLFNQLVETVQGAGFNLFANIPVLIALMMVATASLIFFGLATVVLMLAKVAAVLVVALGPAFIATLIFPPLQRFADAWLSAALNTVIIKVLAAIILTISTLFLRAMVEKVSSAFEMTSVLMDCLKILLLSVSFGGLFGYLPMLSAQLVGGAPLPHLGMPRLSGGGGRRHSDARRDAQSRKTGGEMKHSKGLPFSYPLPAYQRNVIGNLSR